MIMLLVVLFVTNSFWEVEVKDCKPGGKIRGKKPPPKKCSKENNSVCCVEGELYSSFNCSPPVTHHTEAYLTLNSFEKNGDGGGPSECDSKFHSDDILVVALSTGWFNKKGRCFNKITSSGNGRKVKAMVVDECDSMRGCDEAHDYQPPCANNIVDASKAAWVALGVHSDDRGGFDITWSDA